MPGRDGTGPDGRGAGRGPGRRPGRGPTGGGGRGVGRGIGPQGFCVCPSCGEKTPHETGLPCTSKKCPKCGTTMIRD